MGIKDRVLEANQWIVDKGLVELTWGNVSAVATNGDSVVIKPSGVQLDTTTRDDMAAVDWDGNHLSGQKPSVDTPSHLALYNSFPEIASIVHTHSKYATIFAQAGHPIPCLGTTHADYFYGDVPCVPHPPEKEVENDYEENTGRIIGEYFSENELNCLYIPGCVVKGHGVFTWGQTIEAALENAYVLEVVAEMAYKTLMLDRYSCLADFVLEKHFGRKHGDTKYYGQ
tara:strand:+ start:765 stop:1445 length:681 start_codon:yes stop_codon:yes gene_type:complete